MFQDHGLLYVHVLNYLIYVASAFTEGLQCTLQRSAVVKTGTTSGNASCCSLNVWSMSRRSSRLIL